MFKRHGIVWMLTLGLVLVGGVALADDTPDKDDLAELNKAAAEAKITFAQAIETAQKEFADGKVIEVEIDTEKGKPVFEVDLVVGDAVKEVTICAIENKVIKTENDKDEDDKARKLEVARKAIPEAKLSFEQAIEAARKEAQDGKPVEVKLLLSQDKPTYKVEFVTATAKQKYKVDAVEGTTKAG